MREVLRSSHVDVRYLRELFGRLSSKVPGSKVIESYAESTTYLALELDKEVLADLRISAAVVEVFVSGRVFDHLAELGLAEIYEILAKYSPSVKSIAISKAMPSATLYLIIQGDGATLPNVRLMISRDLYDLSSSFCRISPSENTYTLLLKILELGKKYFEEFFR